MKYAFCWALEKAAIKSFRTEIFLPIYPQAPHLRGPEGKVESIVDLVVEIGGGYLIGFEFKTDSLSRVSHDDVIAYTNNLSCIFFTCLSRGAPAPLGSEEAIRSESFWLYEFEHARERFPSVSGSFGLLCYEFITGSLSSLRKPLRANTVQRRLQDLKFSREDELRYKVWKNLKKEGYKVISEPKPKYVEYREVPSISAPLKRKYIYLYSKKAPRIKRIDLVAMQKGTTIGVEVKADLSGLTSIADQLEQYLSIYDLDILFLAVPINLVGRAKSFIASYIGQEGKIKVWGIS